MKYLKKFITYLITIILTLSFFNFNINNVNALTTAVIIDPDGVNVRSGPGTNYSVVTAIGYGKQITLVSTTKYSGSGCGAGWYQINYNGATNRYVCSELVSMPNSSSGTTTTTDGFYTTDTWGYRIAEDYTIVRSSPSEYSQAIENIYLGTKVKVLEYTSNDWVKISYYNGKTGYVKKRLVKTYEDLTATDAEYNKVLQAAGFPESYWPFLTKLHKLHPNWIFKASSTNKNFSTAVNNEVGKCYIQTYIDSYRLSNVVAENPNWYKAASSVVAVYMDPRNYLNETNIFAFEELAYDKNNHTSNILKSMFSGTYLQDDEYIGYFMEAAQKYNVSPVHLASRVKQEGGTNASYDGVSGVSNLTYNGHSLKGVYNYYNIGAYQDGVTSSAVTRGLAVAAELVDKGSFEGTPWNTRQKAIVYGASFIADGYINKGQNTMYYQKFNVSNNAYFSSYTHQYMTNVVAPASESFSTYQTYTNINMMNTAFTFAIPVYNNLPSYFTTLPPIGDTNNYASDIKINGTTINGFDKEVLEYTQYVPFNTSSVNITATKESAVASITGTGTINLNNETTLVEIKVTSQANEVRTYKITIIKQKPQIEEKLNTIEDILNAIDIRYSNGYLTSLSEGTTATTLSNMIYEKNAEATVKIVDKNNKEKSNTNLATNDKITITLNNEVKTYTISIKGDNNSDGIIDAKDLLRVQKHILKYITLTDAEANASDNNYDGIIDAKDLLRIQKHILKYITIK